MNSFLQYGSHMRASPAFRPVVIGALTCGALMVSAGAAQADHRMADGTLCPHAAGTLAPGEAPAAPTVERAASSAPIGATRAAPAAAARPAAKPAAKTPVQRPAAQTQAQRPAASQAQAQRPAAVSQPAVSRARATVPAQTKAQASVPAQRQAPAAKPSGAQQPKAAAGQRTAVKQPVSRPAVTPVVMPEITTDRRGAIERPTATAAAAAPADSGVSVSTAMLAGLLGLFGIIVAGVIAVRRRVVRAATVAPAPRLDESREAAIEAELQAMIAETRARALHAPEDLDEPHEDREFTQTH
jgi:hypothetical protein